MTELYPLGFEPDHTERLKGESGTFNVPGTNLVFKQWRGGKMVNDWRKVPVMYDGRAMFAELAITQMLMRVGWCARWVEVYYLDNGKPYYLLNWNDAKPFKQVSVPPEHSEQLKLMESIESACATRGKDASIRRKPYAGAWDVLAWKNDRVLFIESKRKGKDAINGNQVKWFQGAVDTGLNRDNFMVVQWHFDDD